MAKKNMHRYLLIVVSMRSGKTDEKKENVEGINTAAQKTSLSLKAANAGSVV